MSLVDNDKLIRFGRDLDNGLKDFEYVEPRETGKYLKVQKENGIFEFVPEIENRPIAIGAYYMDNDSWREGDARLVLKVRQKMSTGLVSYNLLERLVTNISAGWPHENILEEARQFLKETK